MAKDEQIKIICRIRPFLDHEPQVEAVRVTEGNTITLDNKRDSTRPYIYKSFSACYPPNATQETIFTQDVLPIVEQVFEGYSSSIFTYGVTGSGKSYSLIGVEQDPGIILRVAEFLFETKQATQVSSIEITMSYMEILKETVFDLLEQDHKNKALSIREGRDKKVYVAGLQKATIETYDDFSELFNKANKKRSTASTKLNSRSSRSHAILTFNVKTVTPVESTNGQQQEDVVMGKINLIDLAGSEDNRKSGNGKARLTESAAINKSLFVLGQVVEALNTKAIRVPFRDSKLTRILQPALGGTSLGMMIINIAPGENFINDTTNTLNFASRTKEVKNVPNINVKRRKVITRTKIRAAQPMKKIVKPTTPTPTRSPKTTITTTVASASAATTRQHPISPLSERMPSRIATTTAVSPSMTRQHPVSLLMERKLAAHDRSVRRVTLSSNPPTTPFYNNNNNSSSSNNNNTNNSLSKKRLFSTYEQMLRDSSKRPRLSIQPDDSPHYRSMTTSSSIYRDTDRRSSIHNTSTTAINKTWKELHSHNHQQQQRRPHINMTMPQRQPRGQYIGTPISLSSENSTSSSDGGGQKDKNQDMVVMTKAAYYRLRANMLLQAKQELITSSRYGSRI